MLPPSLLRARSFVSGCGVYLLTYLALAGVMFYVTLLFQDVEGWSPLRTGVSWLSMNIPFIVAAEFAGRLRRRFQPVVIVVSGCLVGAVGVAVLALLSDTTSFGVAFVGYVLLGWVGHAGTRRRQRRDARCAPWRLGWRVRPRQRRPPGRDIGGTGCPRSHRGPCRHERLGQPQRRGAGGSQTGAVRRRGSDRRGHPCPRFAVPGGRGGFLRVGLPPGVMVAAGATLVAAVVAAVGLRVRAPEPATPTPRRGPGADSSRRGGLPALTPARRAASAPSARQRDAAQYAQAAAGSVVGELARGERGAIELVGRSTPVRRVGEHIVDGQPAAESHVRRPAAEVRPGGILAVPAVNEAEGERPVPARRQRGGITDDAHDGRLEAGRR